MNSVIARYLSVPGVYRWLMCRDPVKIVSLEALERSWVYSIGLGLYKPIRFRPADEPVDAPEGSEVEDLLILTDFCGDFALGTIYGLAFPHIFAGAPLMKEGKVRCRRFAIDLSRTVDLEFVEFVWFEDGKLITMDRTFFHTSTRELPLRAEAILFDSVPPGSLPETVLMRASLIEVPDCRVCAAFRKPCQCPLVESDFTREKNLQVITKSWTNYIAQFMSKARNGRVHLKYFGNIPGVGEVPVSDHFFSTVNILVNGKNRYMNLARRKAIHSLGLHVTPRFDSRLNMPSLLADFENMYLEYMINKNETGVDAYHSETDNLNDGKSLVPQRSTPNAFGRKAVSVEEIFELDAENEEHSTCTVDEQVTVGKDLPLKTMSRPQGDPLSIVDLFELDFPLGPQAQSASRGTSGIQIEELGDVEKSASSSHTRHMRSRSGELELPIADRSRGVRKVSRPRTESAGDPEGNVKRRFSCGQCPASFKTKGDLRRHKLTIHDKVRPYPCDRCNTSFGHRGHLNRHIRTVHERERRFRCQQCGFRFLQASHLDMHVQMVHEKRRPFKCDICSLFVTTRSSLRNHLRHKHQITDRHRCLVQSCDQGFILEVDRDRHMEKVHGGIPGRESGRSDQNKPLALNGLPVSSDLPVSNALPASTSLPVSNGLQVSNSLSDSNAFSHALPIVSL